MIITTTFDVPGYIVDELYGIVTANQVLGNNLISENIAAFTDIFGGKSGQYRGKLDELVEDVTEQMKQKAIKKGANAILGFSISTNQISSKGMSMFMVTATGSLAYLLTDKFKLYKEFQTINSLHNDGIISDEDYAIEKDNFNKKMEIVKNEENIRREVKQKIIDERLKESEQMALDEERRKLLKQEALELTNELDLPDGIVIGGNKTLFGFEVGCQIKSKVTGRIGELIGISTNNKFVCLIENEFEILTGMQVLKV